MALLYRFMGKKYFKVFHNTGSLDQSPRLHQTLQLCLFQKT